MVSSSAGAGAVGAPPSPVRRRGGALLALGAHDAADRLGEALGPHGLHDVVGRGEGEGVDGVLVVRGHEDDLRPHGEAGDHPGERHPVQARHRDVAEDDVDVAAVEHLQRLGAAGRGDDLRDAVVALEEVAEVGQGGKLVVDDERGEPHVVGGHGRSLLPSSGGLSVGMDAGCELRHAEAHLGPGAGRGLHDEPELVAVHLSQPGVDVAQADRVARVGAVEDGADPLGVAADAVVLDGDLWRPSRGRRR